MMKEYSFQRHKIAGGIGADDEYWRYLEEGELRIPKCRNCHGWTWPAHFRCGTCGSWEFEWCPLDVAGTISGTIYSWTRSWYAFDRVAERAEDLPYVTLLVEIEGAGGARLLGMLQGNEDALAVGMPVRGSILAPSEKTKGYPSLVWEMVS